MFIYTVERWWLDVSFIYSTNNSIRKTISIANGWYKVQRESTLLKQTMCNSAEQQIGSHTAWFSAQGPKVDSTHWHCSHSSLGQPRTHCHHAPYATIRLCGNAQMDWYRGYNTCTHTHTHTTCMHILAILSSHKVLQWDAREKHTTPNYCTTPSHYTHMHAHNAVRLHSTSTLVLHEFTNLCSSHTSHAGLQLCMAPLCRVSLYRINHTAS